MHILTLRVGERIRIGTGVTVTIVGLGQQGATLKIVAPEDQRIVKVSALVQHEPDMHPGGLPDSSGTASN